MAKQETPFKKRNERSVIIFPSVQPTVNRRNRYTINNTSSCELPLKSILLHKCDICKFYVAIHYINITEALHCIYNINVYQNPAYYF